MSLLEALACVAILSVGSAGVCGALAGLSRTAFGNVPREAALGVQQAVITRALAAVEYAADGPGALSSARWSQTVTSANGSPLVLNVVATVTWPVLAVEVTYGGDRPGSVVSDVDLTRRGWDPNDAASTVVAPGAAPAP